MIPVDRVRCPDSDRPTRSTRPECAFRVRSEDLLGSERLLVIEHGDQ